MQPKRAGRRVEPADPAHGASNERSREDDAFRRLLRANAARFAITDANRDSASSHIPDPRSNKSSAGKLSGRIAEAARRPAVDFREIEAGRLAREALKDARKRGIDK